MKKKRHRKISTSDKGDNLVNSSDAKGLCLNCDHAGTCKLATFGDEVVYCEEHSSNFDNERRDQPSHRIFTDVPNLSVKKMTPGWDT